MSRSLAVPACLDPDDLEQLCTAIDFVRRNDTEAVLTAMLPTLTATEQAAMAARCRFSHTAALVFPRELSELNSALESLGLNADPAIPSMVVRGRLATRHGRPRQQLDVQIVRAPLLSADGLPCTIEIFAVLAVAGGDIAVIRDTERVAGHEQHLALDVETVDTVELAGLRTLLLQRGGMRSDGGGYNSHEDATILYFRTSTPDRPYRRLELHVAGQHSPLLATHLAASHDAPTRLLRLLTGAWTTQALAATATLGVADQLAAAPGRDITDLARITGTDPDSLHRLLRYLTDLDIVRPRGDGYELTETGALLPISANQSLHPLARLYGGAFYQSFAHLDHAVRTGTAGFDHHFGRHHFEHFSATPESAELFDAAMAAGATIFGQVSELIDLTGEPTIIDIAGGNGTLLSHLLRAAPQARGILFERPSTLAIARSALERSGCLPQCDLVPGDFTIEVPTGGDIYLLSRVLHDWDDDQCARILRRCAAAMPAHARLYIIERLLPDDAAPSLAPAFDIHMLCNVGGRERTRTHYRDLLAANGLTLHATRELPLDFTLMQAIPAV